MGGARKLSARLATIAGFVSDGESVADIGADHGYVPLFVVREGIAPFAVLTDVNSGPLEKTRISLERALGGMYEGMQGGDMNAMAERFSLRLGDGLEPLSTGEVDVVVIAGMGGETIVSILEADPEKARSFRKYVLQPRTKTETLREWLAGCAWKILKEVSIPENGRLCDIIVCSP